MVQPTSPYDFLGLVMTCNVYSADTGKWASFSVQPGKSKPDAHLPWFASMQMKETLSGFGEVTVNLTPPTYEDALALLKSNWLTIGNTMAVRWGYSRHPSHLGPPKYYMMLKPDVSFGDEFTIGLRGTSFGWMTTQMQNQGSLVWNHQFADKQGGNKKKRRHTYKDVIEIVAKRYGFLIDWNGKPKFDKNNFSKDAQTILLSTNEQIDQGGLNDWQFIKMAAAKCCCRSVIVGGNVLRISDVREPKKADWIFRFRGQMDLNNNVVPLDTFDAESTAMFLPTRAVAARFLGPNDKRLGVFPETKADESASKGSLHKLVAKPNSDAPAQRSQEGTNLPHDAAGRKNVPMAGREKFLKEKLQNHFDYNAEKHGVKAKISAVGVPSLLPEDLVRVEGVGDYFTGMYRVFEVNWSVGESFAKMDVELMPKGFPGGTIANWMSQPAKSPYIQKLVKETVKKALGPEKQPVSTDKGYSWFRFMKDSQG